MIDHRDRLTVVDIESGEGYDIWSDSDRTIWATASTPTGEQIAVLTAPSMTANGWSIEFLGSDRCVTWSGRAGRRRGTPSIYPMLWPPVEGE